MKYTLKSSPDNIYLSKIANYLFYKMIYCNAPMIYYNAPHFWISNFDNALFLNLKEIRRCLIMTKIYKKIYANNFFETLKVINK